MFFLVPQIANAADDNNEKYDVVIDGKTYTFLQPFIDENQELYVPIRTFLSVLGGQVAWNDEENHIIISEDNKNYFIETDLAKLEITKNDTIIPIKVNQAQIYMPLSLLKEILNYEIFLDRESKIIFVQKNAEKTSVFKNLPEVPQYKVIDTLTGIASWYGGKFHGRGTSSGEIFDENGLTAAHRTLPFDTYVRVTFLETDKSTIVKINDRGPHVANRIIDLSKKAAEEIGLKPHGLGKVLVEVLENYKA